MTSGMTAQMVETSLQQIQQQLMHVQGQLASGHRINRPSNDPIGTENVLQWQNALDQNTQYQSNAQDFDDDADDAALFWPYRVRIAAEGKFTKTEEGLKLGYLFEKASSIVFFGVLAIIIFISSLFELSVSGGAKAAYVLLLITMVILFAVSWNFYRFAEFHEDQKSVMAILVKIWKISKLKEKEIPP